MNCMYTQIILVMEKYGLIHGLLGQVLVKQLEKSIPIELTLIISGKMGK